uniref:Kri1-like C-terminal domain-containing protein n=1 Tax=Arcella intermedia TaxID=1963864 RepID=A0A6B2L1D2_9EUKA
MKDKYGSLLRNSDSESESESEPEDENAELIDDKVAEDFLSLLPKLANRDGSLKDPNVKFFKEEPQKIIEKQKKQKAYTYKDMVREEVLENLNKQNFTEDDVSHTTKPIDFEEQPIAQKEIIAKKEFLKAAALDDEDDTLLKKRVKSKEEAEKEENEYLKFVQSLRKKKDPSAEVLVNYWTDDKNVDEDEKFLRSYIINKGWVDKNNEEIPTYDEIINEDDEDEKDIQQQEKYEEAFNFRFEEPGSTVVPSFPRNPEESARKPDEKRKLKRQRRKEKKDKEKKQKEDEKKHLMRLKKEQIMDRLKIISEITGATDEKLKGIDLDGEWDPEAYDKEMNSVFNNDYYNEQENEDEKPVFSDEEEAPLPQIPGHSIRKEAQGEGQEGKEVDPKVLEEEKKELDKYLEEYYKLDYEDIVGGIPCRFKYTKVKPLDYGLDSHEILMADDTDLRKIIPLKRLNPYREDQGELPPHKRRQNFKPSNNQWNNNNRNKRDNNKRNNNRNNKK